MTCALLRQYMRKNQGQGQGRMGDLVRLFQAPPPWPVAPEENDDMTTKLFPVGAAMVQPPAQERPEAKKAPSVTIFYEVPQVDEAQMRTPSLHRFLRKRKLRISETDPDHNEDKTPAKKQKDAAVGEPFLDMPDPSWLRL